MDFIEIENTFTAIVLIILAALIPIAIIWTTIRMIRKKRARGEERSEVSGRKFTSVKEERLDKKRQEENKIR